MLPKLSFFCSFLYLASDQLALLPVTRRFIYLEEGDIVEITRRHVHIYDVNGEEVNRDIHSPIVLMDNSGLSSEQQRVFANKKVETPYQIGGGVSYIVMDKLMDILAK